MNDESARDAADASESALDDAILLDFLARYVADRDAGRARSLADYQSLHPRHATVIAQAYARAIGEAAAPPSSPSHAVGPAATTRSPLSSGTGDAVSDTPAPASRVGPYRLLRELGRGGQAVVWLARDERLERDVALKTVPRSPLFEDLAPRFRREAVAASSLAHPAICAVYDVGADDRFAWIAMRYVPGETLARRITTASTPLPIAEILLIGEKVARALHTAHEAGVVHRDVKPANIMLDERGEPVVLDFGIALQVEGATLTLSGEAVGTPAYMAPESLAHAGRRADRRVDVFALGVTLYEMATLERPFRGPTRDTVVRAILEQEPLDPRRVNPAVSRDLATVITTALDKDPDRRYRTADDLADDLRRVRLREPIAARPAGALRKLARFCERRPALAASLGALFLVLATGLGITARLLANTRDALAEKSRSLERFVRLADLKRAGDLLARETSLWPAVPEHAPEMRRWLEEAERIRARADIHRAALAEKALASDVDPAGGEVAETWLRERTTELLDEIARVATAADSVQRRLAFALEVDARTIEAPAAAWSAAAERVKADPRFGDAFALAPQRGLVPIGPDSASGLEEFAHLETGAVPSRAADGSLTITPESALVFILIPGGTIAVGSAPRPPENATAGESSADNVDPEAGPYDGPICRVRLDAFFVSKYEMTQGQWARHTATRPSTYHRGSKWIDDATADLHPVETIDWNHADLVMRQLDLDLPTEAQWERAARAGATTPWWSGSEASSLAGVDNLADDFARANGGGDMWQYEPGLDDGRVIHAPVGSYRANPFGLHDVHGNVREWCRDTWEDWATNPPRDGDGFTTGVEIARCFRGGSFASSAALSRSGRRDGLPPHLGQFTTGLRPARALRSGSGSR